MVATRALIDAAERRACAPQGQRIDTRAGLVEPGIDTRELLLGQRIGMAFALKRGKAFIIGLLEGLEGPAEGVESLNGLGGF